MLLGLGQQSKSNLKTICGVLVLTAKDKSGGIRWDGRLILPLDELCTVLLLIRHERSNRFIIQQDKYFAYSPTMYREIRSAPRFETYKDIYRNFPEFRELIND